jgi:uncharacterized iron-regulated membrane protein
MTGLVLWWPRKALTFARGAGKSLSWRLHNVVGFWAYVFLLIFAVTGLVVQWGDLLLSKTGSSYAQLPDPRSMRSTPVQGAQPLALDRVVELSLAAAPGARVTEIALPPRPAGPIRVWMKFPEDGTPAGRTWLLMDQFSGRILWLRNARTAPASVRYLSEWNREIHTGDIFGWPTRILACIASLALPLLAVTGPLIRWGKRRAARKLSRSQSAI